MRVNSDETIRRAMAMRERLGKSWPEITREKAMSGDLVKVTQADRVGCAAYVAVAFGERYAKSVLEAGRWPDLTQAFARHRVQAAEEMRERCARVADAGAAAARPYANGIGLGPACERHAMREAESIATVIRFLQIEGPMA